MAPVSRTAPAIKQPGHQVSLLALLSRSHTLASKDAILSLCYVGQLFSALLTEQLHGANVHTLKLLFPLPTALGKFCLTRVIVEAEKFW